MKCSPIRLGLAVVLTVSAPALVSAGRAFTGRLITPAHRRGQVIYEMHIGTYTPAGSPLVIFVQVFPPSRVI